MKTPSYSMKDENTLKKNMRKFMGEQIELFFEYVSEIPRESNGKFRQIVSNINIS
ncbi:MAG: hypothetical protein U9R02_09090 [Thermodesulfobacteriota bacterium]|nr:hypothetical protein [Thermodesulfobacteriota bacterium]